MSRSSGTAPGARPANRSRAVSTVTKLHSVIGVPASTPCTIWTFTFSTAGQRRTRGTSSDSTRMPQGTMAIGTLLVAPRLDGAGGGDMARTAIAESAVTAAVATMTREVKPQVIAA